MTHICVHLRPKFVTRLRFESKTDGRLKAYVALNQNDFDEFLLEASEIIDEVTRIYKDLKGGNPMSKRRMLVRRFVRLLNHKNSENPTAELLERFNEQEWNDRIEQTFEDSFVRTSSD